MQRKGIGQRGQIEGEPIRYSPIGRISFMSPGAISHQTIGGQVNTYINQNAIQSQRHNLIYIKLNIDYV